MQWWSFNCLHHHFVVACNVVTYCYKYNACWLKVDLEAFVHMHQLKKEKSLWGRNACCCSSRFYTPQIVIYGKKKTKNKEKKNSSNNMLKLNELKMFYLRLFHLTVAESFRDAFLSTVWLWRRYFWVLIDLILIPDDVLKYTLCGRGR